MADLNYKQGHNPQIILFYLQIYTISSVSLTLQTVQKQQAERLSYVYNYPDSQ